jgi:hypothetical protein
MTYYSILPNFYQNTIKTTNQNQTQQYNATKQILIRKTFPIFSSFTKSQNQYYELFQSFKLKYHENLS